MISIMILAVLCCVQLTLILCIHNHVFSSYWTYQTPSRQSSLETANFLELAVLIGR